MSTLSWNCRGLGNPRAIRALKDIIKVKGPKIVFLMETKLNSKRMMQLKQKFGFQNGFAVDCVGKSGGLALLWAGDVDVNLQSFSCGHIDVLVKGGQGY